MRYAAFALLIGLVLLGATSVWPQDQPTPAILTAPAFDFESDSALAAWWANDGQAKLALTHDKANVAHGLGALEITYTPREGAYCLFGARNLAPTPARSLRCRLKTDLPTPLVIAVQEQDKSSYHAFVCTPANQWTEVALDLSELGLTEDTQDENNKLDPEQIVSLTIADLSNLPGEVGRALGHKLGEQHLWLDDVALSPDPAPLRSTVRGKTRCVDGFEHPSIAVLPIGPVKLGFQPGAPAPRSRGSLRIAYRLGGHRWAGIVSLCGHVNLAGCTHFSCFLRSSHEGAGFAVLEERDGSKYQHALTLDGSGKWEQLRLPLSEFALDPQTKDENNRLDLDQLRIIALIVDTFNATVGEDGEATLDLDDLALSEEE